MLKEEKQLAFEDLKAAKISSECLLNIHKAERQAWNMDAAKAAPTIVIERSFGGGRSDVQPCRKAPGRRFLRHLFNRDTQRRRDLRPCRLAWLVFAAFDL